jgi:hypothetical protein
VTHNINKEHPLVQKSSIKRKINQVDTSRANRLPVKGPDIQSKGIFLPINDIKNMNFNNAEFK